MMMSFAVECCPAIGVPAFCRWSLGWRLPITGKDEEGPERSKLVTRREMGKWGNGGVASSGVYRFHQLRPLTLRNNGCLRNASTQANSACPSSDLIKPRPLPLLLIYPSPSFPIPHLIISHASAIMVKAGEYFTLIWLPPTKTS